MSTLEYPVPCEYTGELAIGADFVHESIVGSTFTGRLVPPPPTSAPGPGPSTAAHLGTGNGLTPGPHRHWAHPL